MSVESIKSGNLNIKVEILANMTYTDDDIQNFNILDFIKFGGNVFFVDSTLSTSQTPSSSSSGSTSNQELDSSAVLPSDSKTGATFQFADFQKNKVNHNLGLLFHSFSKGDVDNLSIALLLAKPLSNQIGYYQVYSNGAELTNKVQVTEDMGVSAFDLVKING